MFLIYRMNLARRNGKRNSKWDARIIACMDRMRVVWNVR